MGNHMSCMYSPVAYNNIIHNTATQLHTPTITILNGCTGAIAELPPPLTAAELMIDYPGQFISCYNPNPSPNSGSGARHVCSALPAEHELGTKEIYLLLPMHKLNSRLSEKENAYINAVLHHRRIVQLEVIAELEARQESVDCISRFKFCRRSNYNTINGRVAPFPANQVSPRPAPADNNGTKNEEDDYDQYIVNVSVANCKDKENRALSRENRGSRAINYVDHEEDNDDDHDIILQTPASLRRLETSISRSKSWIPSLETILECSKSDETVIS